MFLPADDGKDRHSELLAAMASVYANASSSSPCIPAMLAMAWATSASFCTVDQRMGAARRKYSEALVKLQQALQHTHTARTDHVLFAVLIMSWVEVRVMPLP